MVSTESIGQRIKQVRGELSQKAFGARVGLSQTAVTALENDQSEPRLGTFSSIVEAFGVNPDWLRTGRGSMRGAPTEQPKPTLTIAAEPAASYGCAAPELATGLAAEVAELRVENKQLRDELRQARKEAREDLIGQARTYNSVKQGDAELITKLYAYIDRLQIKIDEYELTLGYRKPTPAERQAQEQAGSGAPRMKIIPLGARYRNTEPAEATECVVREMYPTAEVSQRKAA